MILQTDTDLYLLESKKVMNKKLNFKILLIVPMLLLLIVSGCNKQELPEPVEGKPQVWMECNINNAPIKFEVDAEMITGCAMVKDGSNSMIRQFSTEIKSETHNVSVEIIINNNNYELSSIEADLKSTVRSRPYKFSYTSQFPYPYKVGEVIINYRDLSNGHIYTSLAYPQLGSNGSFNIASIKEVESNGKKYLLAEVNFTCKAKNPVTGKLYTITGGHGFIPFGGYN